MTQKKPKLGVLALMLEDYLPLFPGIDRAQTAYVNEVLDGLRDAAEFVFPHAAMNRAQIESLVAQYNHEKLDGILILLLTYSQGAYLVRALEENHLPLALALIQPEQTVRPDFIEWDYTVNQGIHGSQDQANVMTRMGVNCVYYAGNRCDGSFVRFVADFWPRGHDRARHEADAHRRDRQAARHGGRHYRRYGDLPLPGAGAGL